MNSNLPPGVTNSMIEDAMGANAQCEVCHKHIDACICPECPQCEEIGNPMCYSLEACGLVLSREQKIAQAEYDVYLADTRLMDAKQYLDWLKDNPEGANV